MQTGSSECRGPVGPHTHPHPLNSTLPFLPVSCLMVRVKKSLPILRVELYYYTHNFLPKPPLKLNYNLVFLCFISPRLNYFVCSGSRKVVIYAWSRHSLHGSHQLHPSGVIFLVSLFISLRLSHTPTFPFLVSLLRLLSSSQLM